METGTKLLEEISDEMKALGLEPMSEMLRKLYYSPQFVTMDRLEIISDLISVQYTTTANQQYQNRLKKARLIGEPCELGRCRTSRQRAYEPDIVPNLGSLEFVRQGHNLCIFGASDSGKTYLAKALGIEACRKYRTEYYRCAELLEELVATKEDDYKRYKRRIGHLSRLDLLILDDFLLHSVTDEAQKKVLYEVLEKRNELSRSCIICSQREPITWKLMFLQDEVSSNSILKRVTKDYSIAITRSE